MRAIILQYFKDSRGHWHQPGNMDEFEKLEADELRRRGAIKIINTEMVEQPEDRVVRFPKVKRMRAQG
jgi:hypothetical protein